MWKKGDLVSYGAYHALSLGTRRLKEKFDDEGYGGLYVPQMKIVIVNDTGKNRTYSPGAQLWVDCKLVKRLS